MLLTKGKGRPAAPRAGSGRPGCWRLLDRERRLRVAVVVRVAREALAEARVAVAEAAARALRDELVLVVRGRLELDDELRAHLLAHLVVVRVVVVGAPDVGERRHGGAGLGGRAVVVDDLVHDKVEAVL